MEAGGIRRHGCFPPLPRWLTIRRTCSPETASILVRTRRARKKNIHCFFCRLWSLWSPCSMARTNLFKNFRVTMRPGRACFDLKLHGGWLLRGSCTLRRTSPSGPSPPVQRLLGLGTFRPGATTQRSSVAHEAVFAAREIPWRKRLSAFLKGAQEDGSGYPRTSRARACPEEEENELEFGRTTICVRLFTPLLFRKETEGRRKELHGDPHGHSDSARFASARFWCPLFAIQVYPDERRPAVERHLQSSLSAPRLPRALLHIFALA